MSLYSVAAGRMGDSLLRTFGEDVRYQGRTLRMTLERDVQVVGEFIDRPEYRTRFGAPRDALPVPPQVGVEIQLLSTGEVFVIDAIDSDSGNWISLWVRPA